jgi:hypothetical protein
VRAIFLKIRGTCSILVSIDHGLLSSLTTDGARARLKQCPRDNIMISATHSHSAGDLATSVSVAPTREYMNADAKRVEDAIVNAVEIAAKSTRIARLGFGTARLDLNVNRDAFDGQEWYQGPNPEGPSDKTLSVLYFLGADDLPIAVLMNYGMHPINFYLTGVVSADFPGEAARYLERRFDGAIALYTQGASGDQNPLLGRPLGRLLSARLASAKLDDRITSPSFWQRSARLQSAGSGATPSKDPVVPFTIEDARNQYRSAIAETGEIVIAMGAVIGETAIDAMRQSSQRLSGSPSLWSGSIQVTCPGRDRVDTSGRQGVRPNYRDGDPVEINVGLLRIGDVALVGVDSELYSEIVQHLKSRSPLSATMVMGLTNGWGKFGYIYSNNASDHLTFQVIGSRLKPGCAEDKIIDAALQLIAQSGLPLH